MNYQLRIHFSILILFISFCFIPGSLYAAGSGITYNGRLLDPNGNAVVSNNVQFRLQIRTPGNENCLMYEEIQTKDMTNSDGVFSITINDGTGSRTDATGFTLDQIFANRGSFNFPGGYCVTGSVYNTTPTDGRKLQVYFNDGSFATGQWEPTPAMAINFIPMAIEAQQVGGYKKEQILKIADGVSTTGTELDATKWTSLQALINGTSTVYSKPTDAITQLQGAALPAPANGQSIRWNTALNAGAGGWENFTAGTASAVVSVSSANSDISVVNASTTPELTLNAGTGANQIVKLNGTAQLPAVDGANLTNVSASKIVGTAISIASLANGQVLKYNGTNWVNASDADALGGLSCANGRVAYYTGGSWACLEVTSGNTINTIVSRDGSGLSNFGTVNAGTLKVNDGASGEISITTPVTVASYGMRLPTSVGTSGYVLTTDGNSPAQLSWSPMSSAQWSVSGSDLYYNTGNVGIGTSTPSKLFHVTGDQAGGIAKIERSTSLTTGPVGTIDLVAKSTGDMTDGYGPSFNFIIKDTANVDNIISYIASLRAGGDNSGDLAFMTSAGGTLSEKMRITSTGNVGVGTTVPTYKLEVNGNTRVSSALSVGSGISMTGNIQWSTQVAGLGESFGLKLFSSPTRPIQIPDGSLFVGYDQTDNTSRGVGNLLVSSSVGIGTISPSATLHVAQTSQAGAMPNALTVAGASSSTAATAGSSIALTAGNGNTTGSGGSITLTTGTGDNGGSASLSMQGGKYSGAAVTLTAGSSGGGGGGAVNINGGYGSVTGTQTGGSVNLTGGNSNATYNGGNIVLNGGDALGTGTDGNVLLATVRGKIGIGTTSPGFDIDASGKTMRLRTISLDTAGNTMNFDVTTDGASRKLLNIGSAWSIYDTYGLYFNGINSGSFKSVLTGASGGWDAGLISMRHCGISAHCGDMKLEAGGVTDQLYLSNTGTIGIGTTSPEARLDITDAGTTTSAIIVPRAGNFTGTSVNGMIRYNTASTLFEFYQNGAWVNYTTVSDARLKTNVEPVRHGLKIVNQLNPVFYDWDRSNPKSVGFADKHQVGFIAQEVEKVLPEVVNKGEDSYRSLEYGKMVAVVVAAVKELYVKISSHNEQLAVQKLEMASKADRSETEALKIENQKLQQENDKLKARLDKIEEILNVK